MSPKATVKRAAAKKTTKKIAVPSTDELQKLARQVIKDGMKSPAYKKLSKAIATSSDQLQTMSTPTAYVRAMSWTDSKLPALCHRTPGAGATIARDLQRIEEATERLFRDVVSAVTGSAKPRASAAKAPARPKAPAKAAAKPAARKPAVRKPAARKKTAARPASTPKQST